MAKKAFITGITGQDGSYLAELLLEKGYEVYGLVRRLSTPNTERIKHIAREINFVEGDLTDLSSIADAVRKIQPDEVYNLGAQSFVATSWKQPVLTGDVTGLGVMRILVSLREFCPDAKMYQASSSEIFGDSPSPQNEQTPIRPKSPYAVAKAYGYYATINFRDTYGMFCCNGVLFNHESPRRGVEFVTRKITDGVAKIYFGLEDELRLGNLDAKRDWGYAGDYVKAMWLMLQQDSPDDYVIATGENHSIREFVHLAFAEVGLDCEKFVKIDDRFRRPVDVWDLRGDASKARERLGWTPETSFEDLLKMMLEEDLEKYRNQKV